MLINHPAKRLAAKDTGRYGYRDGVCALDCQCDPVHTKRNAQRRGFPSPFTLT